MPYILKPHLTRKITILSKDDKSIPQELFTAENVKPDLADFPYPLPSKKDDYTCFAEGNNGVIWFGGKTGVTRYDEKADILENKIMYFSATRHIAHEEVDKIYADGDDLWVLTQDKVSHIEMIKITCEEKAEMLLEETNKYVNKRGVCTQVVLDEPGNIESFQSYSQSDNDGSFTAAHAAGEIFHYGVMKRKYGIDHEKTRKAFADAVKSCEACLLLTYIHGRDEGFVSRAYHIAGEPVPDDGLFYERKGDKAYCYNTTAARKRGIVGEEVSCTYPIPERLRHLFTDLGCTEEGIVYKADTSSDEITSHFMQMKVAHDILGPDDKELDDIIKDACKRTMKHIIDGGFELIDIYRPTTWARWSKKYFENTDTGYVDAPLNAGELLFYLKATMHITGEKGIWQETYDKLIADGYDELPQRHFNRFYQGAMMSDAAPEEDLMYGDNMLATMSHWLLCTLEDNPVLLEKYKKGYKSWAGSLLREHMPGYDFPYMVAMGEGTVDVQRDAEWFYRHEVSRLNSFVDVRRHDVPTKENRDISRGTSEEEVSALLPPDERTIQKYDRNPFNASAKSTQPGRVVEGCYDFTFAYWMGRYFNIIDEEEN